MTDDDANRNSHSSHERVLTLASRSWHKTIMTQVSEKTTFGLVPYTQFRKMTNEKPAVMRLWYECWHCDPYGSRWMQMETHLTGKTLKEAKARIRALGLFEFKSEVMLGENGQRHWQMYVINLEGSKSTGVVKTPSSNRSGVENYPTWGKETPHMGQEITLGGVEKDPSNPPETVAGQELQQSSLPSKDLKKITTTSQNPDVVVSPFVEEDPNSVHISATNPVELSPDLGIQNLSCDSNLRKPSSCRQPHSTPSMKSSAAPHVESHQNTSRSHEDAPEAPLASQTSNPTPATLSELTARFSLAVESVLFDLDSALAAKGRQKEIDDLLKLQKTLKSYDEQTILDAVRYVIEKLDSVKSLGAYLRKALEGSYKPSQQQITQQTTKATPEEPKPYRGGLEGFLSESSIDLYNDANFSGWYLQQCDLQLRRDWHKGEAEHRTIICYWRSMQKAGVSPVI